MSGVVVPLVTPLTCDDKVDTVSLRKLTEYLISHGVDCLYPCGTTGEMMYLSVEERKLVASTVIKQAAGRIPVFVHVGAWNQKDTIDLAQHACQAGADGIGVVTPVYFPISEEGLIRYFKTVACSVPESFPVYLYGIKQNAVNDINVNICNEVAGSCRNVLGAKYSFPDMTMIQNLVLVNEGRFDVLVGPDHLYAAASAAGCCGVVSGNANVIPDHYTSIREALKENNSREAF